MSQSGLVVGQVGFNSETVGFAMGAMRLFGEKKRECTMIDGSLQVGWVGCSDPKSTFEVMSGCVFPMKKSLNEQVDFNFWKCK